MVVTTRTSSSDSLAHDVEVPKQAREASARVAGSPKASAEGASMHHPRAAQPPSSGSMIGGPNASNSAAKSASQTAQAQAQAGMAKSHTSKHRAQRQQLAAKLGLQPRKRNPNKKARGRPNRPWKPWSELSFTAKMLLAEKQARRRTDEGIKPSKKARKNKGPRLLDYCPRAPRHTTTETMDRVEASAGTVSGAGGSAPLSPHSSSAPQSHAIGRQTPLQALETTLSDDEDDFIKRSMMSMATPRAGHPSPLGNHGGHMEQTQSPRSHAELAAHMEEDHGDFSARESSPPAEQFLEYQEHNGQKVDEGQLNADAEQASSSGSHPAYDTGELIAELLASNKDLRIQVAKLQAEVSTLRREL